MPWTLPRLLSFSSSLLATRYSLLFSSSLLPHGKACIRWNIPANVRRQHAGLDLQHAAVAHLVTEDGVRHHRCFPLFIGLEEPLAPLIREVTRFAPDEEILGRQAAG